MLQCVPKRIRKAYLFRTQFLHHDARPADGLDELYAGECIVNQIRAGWQIVRASHTPRADGLR